MGSENKIKHAQPEVKYKHSPKERKINQNSAKSSPGTMMPHCWKAENYANLYNYIIEITWCPWKNPALPRPPSSPQPWLPACACLKAALLLWPFSSRASSAAAAASSKWPAFSNTRASQDTDRLISDRCQQVFSKVRWTSMKSFWRNPRITHPSSSARAPSSSVGVQDWSFSFGQNITSLLQSNGCWMKTGHSVFSVWKGTNTKELLSGSLGFIHGREGVTVTIQY